MAKSLVHHFLKKLIKAIKTIIKTFEVNKKTKNEDFLSVFNRIGIDAFKKDLYEKVILNREKVSQNDYLLIEDITSLPKSNTKKVIVTTPQWLEIKKL